ncbi:hypothetical protein F8388_008054 [Cannabis sativa]|uniref:S-locus receptor kinase C-terminal domain-containing protein n=1 Tax=Cannabis sativa TaxID=3483 RepID=A0A7J6DXL3_CANSA|nr:hypothetical protein F8388_008054 [Cannabis sativa]
MEDLEDCAGYLLIEFATCRCQWILGCLFSAKKRKRKSDNCLAWRLWEEGKELEFVDPLVIESSTKQEILKCIRIGLLCVQEDPEDRPTMSSVVASLQQESEPVPLSEPKQPFAFAVSNAVLNNPSTIDPTLNGLTFSAILPR